jgi:DtxR family transcriptional regulator, Mn-dependent transcriptional regulator
MASPVTEEYLEAIYNMTMEGEAVIGARLAEKFRVSRATVTETIRRLATDGYVEQRPDKSVQLTGQGRLLTEQVLRRHRLAERLLFDLVGLDWISAHEQAHTLEHGMSDELASQISERLGNPLTCPHGNPIPGNAASAADFLRQQHAFRLSEASRENTVRVVLISEVVEDESEVLRSLSGKGLRPGSILKILDADLSSAVVFQTENGLGSVPPALAARIWVTADGEVG